MIEHYMFYLLCIHSFVRILLHVLFVEAHGRDYGACGPVYHDVRQEVIQTELPVQIQQTQFNYKQKQTL